MINYNQPEIKGIEYNGSKISSFVLEDDSNIDWSTVDSFGEEWDKFNFFSDEEITQAGDEYFDVIDDTMIDENSLVLDVGCGSGRWSKYLSSRVAHIEAIDPSNSIFQAFDLLKLDNTRVTHASVNNIPFKDNSFDLVFSLGVLHHIPDTFKALKNCVSKVKPGGYFMVYLYYSLDNRGEIYKLLFFMSDLFRRIIYRLPAPVKRGFCDIIAIVIYYPFASLSKLLLKFSMRRLASKMPLHNYHDKTFRLMRNDALDRFGTPLEQRFSKKEIKDMLENAGLYDIKFSDREPYWHAIAKKK